MTGRRGDDSAPHMAGRPYSTRELAERWGVSGQCVRMMIERGELPFFKVGAVFRIPASAVEEKECLKSAQSSTVAGGMPSGPTMPAKPSAGRSAPKIVMRPNGV